MGLASKLAASQNQAGGGGGGGGQQQQQYGAPPQQQQQYGAPPPPQQQQYGQPPSGGMAGVGSGGAGGAPSVPGGRPQSGQYAPPPGPPPQAQQGGQHGFPQPTPTGPGSQQYGQQGQYGQPQQQQYGQPQQQQGQYGQPPQQQGQYGQPQQQGQYGAPPPPYGQQQGQQQQQWQGQYGGAPPSGEAGQLLSLLQQCVQDQNLQAFYPPGSLDMIAAKVASSGALGKIAQEWRMDKEIASDLVKLSLFDVILYLDDSGSMAFEERGERIDDLKLIMSRVAYATSLFDQDGINVEFMNSKVSGRNVATEQAALQLLNGVKFSGLTPLGTSMWNKVIQPMVLGPARSGQLQKPVLIITITDGTPAGESRDEILNVILRTDQELKRSRYGGDAVSYQFAQVGNDMKAMKFLEELDNDPRVGSLIDCTSNYEAESMEMQQKSGIELTPEMWLVKLLMGPIDSSYDTKDE